MLKNRDFYNFWWKANGWPSEVGDFQWKWPIIGKSIPRKGIIADICCGVGIYIEKFRQLNSRKIIEFVISSYAINQSRKKYPDVEFRAAAVDEYIPLKNPYVNFIFAADVIEHLFDVQKFVREFDRIFKKSGNLYITTPYHGLV